jgi:hypothetical protein
MYQLYIILNPHRLIETTSHCIQVFFNNFFSDKDSENGRI